MGRRNGPASRAQGRTQGGHDSSRLALTIKSRFQGRLPRSARVVLEAGCWQEKWCRRRGWRAADGRARGQQWWDGGSISVGRQASASQLGGERDDQVGGIQEQTGRGQQRRKAAGSLDLLLLVCCAMRRPHDGSSLTQLGARKTRACVVKRRDTGGGGLEELGGARAAGG